MNGKTKTWIWQFGGLSLYKYYMEDYVGSQDTLGNGQDCRTIDDFKVVKLR